MVLHLMNVDFRTLSTTPRTPGRQALSHPDFARYAYGRFAATLAWQMIDVVLGYQVWELTKKEEYLALKSQWGGFAGFDRFFTTVNNANLASVAIYHALVPQFQQILARHDGDLAAFYDEVRTLANLDQEARAKALGAGQPPVAPVR